MLLSRVPPERQPLRAVASYLRDDSGVAGLIIAMVIMIIASTATMIFLRDSSSPILRELRSLTSSGASLSTIASALHVAAIQDADQVFPCPADPTATGAAFGQASSASGAVCSRTRGIVPFRTIGLSEDDVRDAYGSFITYVIDPANAAMCDGTGPNTGSLTDLNGAAETVFALISHGKNRAGGFNDENNPTSTEPSTAEAANCPADHPNCAVGTVTEIRSGPTNPTEGADYFDDNVFLADSDSFQADCQELNEDPNVPEGAQQSFDMAALPGLPAARLANVIAGTSQNTTNRRSAPAMNVTDGVARATFAAGINQPSASCYFFQSDVPLQGNVLRTYGEYFFEQDVASARGNGLLLAFLGARNNSGVEFAPSNYNDVCGGTDQYMGFEDDPVTVARRFDATLNRFGVEIDTHSHYDGTTNSDSVNNHVAVVARNVRHSGAVVGTDGPVCRSDATGLGGTDFDGGVASASGNGCRVGPVADWLENGDPIANPTLPTNVYTQIRTEAHWYAGAGCDDLTEFRLDLWVFPTGSHCTNGCDNLSEDYTAAQPDASYCLPQQTGLETVRVGFTTGFPASSSTVDARSSVQRFGYASERVDGIPPTGKVYAGDTARSQQVTEYEVRAALGYGEGVSVDSNFGSARLDSLFTFATAGYSTDFSTYPLTVFSRQGTFRLQNNAGLGVGGIGDSTSWLDNVDIAEPQSADVSEKIEFEYDNLFRRFAVNIRSFGVANGVGMSSYMEQVRLRAYNGTTLVADETIEACAFNDATSDAYAMAIARDFGADFDRVQIIPVQLDSSSAEGFTRVRVRGARACGAGEMCGFEPDLPTVVQSRCHDIDLPSPGTAGSGASPEITGPILSAALGSPGTNLTTNRSWIEFPSLDATVMTERGYLRVFGNGGTDDGLGILGSATSASNLIDNGDDEELRIVYNNTWQKLYLTLGRFGGDNVAPASLENAVARFYLDGTLVETKNLQACSTGTGTGTSGGFQIDGLSNFNEVRISAANAVDGSVSQFLVRDVRACDALSVFDSTCTLTAAPTCTVVVP